MTETIAGYLDRISYHNAENDYTVARFIVSGTEERITIVGHLCGVREGENLRLTGNWKQHPRFGTQFGVESFESIYPETEAGIERYLGSGLIKGIGPKTAERIVGTFGRETLDVIERVPESLKKVPGLGPKKIDQIKQAWDEQRGIRRLMIFLQSYGIGGSVAVRIYRRYRDKGVEAVSQNPYRLAEEVRGIGFATADKIAGNLGFAADSPLRIESGLIHTGVLAQEKGHTCLPRESFLEQAGRLLGLSTETLEPVLAELANLGKLILEKDQSDGREYVYPVNVFWAEMTSAERLGRLISESGSGLAAVVDFSKSRSEAVADFERKSSLNLSREQKEAIFGALDRGVAVITGGPGTGKTTLIAALVSILERENLAVVLAAPTGRAAKRMSEATGTPASTIHRLLGWSFNEGGFIHDADKPLKGDVFIIDEVSMVDLLLFASLVDALPAGAMLVLVGDVDQLPSIGPGRVLADLIGSRTLPIYRLGRVFRQAALSSIILNAHRVRQGKMPLKAGADDQNANRSGIELSGGKEDFFFVNQPDPVKAREMIVRMAAERLQARFGIDPGSELQVITPMNRGLCGTRELNAAIQQALNPHGREISFTRRGFRVGDRVMQIRNDYEKDVYNGDVGRIVGCEEDSQTVKIDYDGRIVEYDAVELDDVTVAYAVTVHKSQGSEYPAVIITLLNEHYVMLQRNLLYTAISRGRRLVVLIGDPQAVSRAVRNARVQYRHSRLAQRLQSVLKLC